MMEEGTLGAVYAQSNDAERNEIIAFRREADGALMQLGRYETGGRGTGKPHLASQGSVVLAGDRLLVANAGSDDVSVFAIEPGGPRLADRVASRGAEPTSIAVHGDLVYVLNHGRDEAANVTGFRLSSDGKLTVLEGSTRPASSDGADPAQVAFSPDGATLVLTERGTNTIATFAIDDAGYADGPNAQRSSGPTPYGFDFTSTGVLVVTEAFGAQVGAAAASSYALTGGTLEPRSASVQDTRSEVCWAVVSKDDRFAYVTNFGDGTISSYAIGPNGALELLEPVAGSTVLGVKGVRDEALSEDGRYLYALDADAGQVFGFRLEDDGGLAPIGSSEGLPETVAGLAAR